MPNRGLRWIVSIAAVTVAVFHLRFPEVKADAITAGFIGIALIPWLAPLVKSLEIPGIGKLELQEARDEAARAHGAAESAGRQAQLAIARSEPRHAPNVAEAKDTSLDALAAEYDDVRSQLSSGSARTARMTEIVSRMIDVTRPMPAFDVDGALQSNDRGKRMTAYARLYSVPEAQHWDALTRAVALREDKPFGQYWGILALQQLAGTLDTAQIKNLLLQPLVAMLAQLKPGTDRHYELSKLLEQLRR